MWAGHPRTLVVYGSWANLKYVRKGRGIYSISVHLSAFNGVALVLDIDIGFEFDIVRSYDTHRQYHSQRKHKDRLDRNIKTRSGLCIQARSGTNGIDTISIFDIYQATWKLPFSIRNTGIYMCSILPGHGGHSTLDMHGISKVRYFEYIKPHDTISNTIGGMSCARVYVAAPFGEGGEI